MNSLKFSLSSKAFNGINGLVILFDEIIYGADCLNCTFTKFLHTLDYSFFASNDSKHELPDDKKDIIQQYHLMMSRV